MMNHDIFISYSSKQSNIAKRVCDYLEGNGVKCWIAPRDIPAGSEYGDEIGNAIQQAKVVVLVFSESASLSLWVKGEINTAFDERKTIIPFRIDNTELTKGLKVMLNQFHWIDSTQDMSSALDELLETIESLIGKKICKGPLIEVTIEAGHLMEECQRISEATDEGLAFFAARNFTNLKIHGEMDARDFYFLKTFTTMLEYLDISDVKIKEFYGPYGTMHDFHSMAQLKDVQYDADEIPSGAFFYWIPKDEGMPSLREITLPEGITRIRRNAFARAYNLTKINIPNGVTGLDHWCFCCCFSLKEIEIPESVVEIEREAFTGSPLQVVHSRAALPPKLDCEGFGVFDCAEIKGRDRTLYVPKGSLKAYEESDWATYFNKIVEE